MKRQDSPSQISNLKDLTHANTCTLSASSTINQIQPPPLPITQLALDLSHPFDALSRFFLCLGTGELGFVEFILEVLF